MEKLQDVDRIEIAEAEIADTAEVDEQDNLNKLFIEYRQTHDVELRNKIVMQFSSIAKTVAFQMRGIFNDYAQMEDIVNQGIITLIDCVEKFDPEKNVKFQTYAYMRMRGAVIDFVRKQDWIPRRIRIAAKNINKAHDDLCNELMREPTHAEIAYRLNMSVSELDKYYGEISGAVTLSFESSVQGMNYSEDTLGEPVDTRGSADGELYRDELKKVIAKSLDKLTERERQVVSLYYYDELKQADIASVLEISEQRVSQIMTKAIQKIRFTVEKYVNS